MTTTQPSRNIILLSDGTGNSRGKHFTTNVWRVYEALDLMDPVDPAHPRQFAFYDDGVGSSSFKPLALLGGALGIGLARNVRDLYRFLCRTYRPGDRIYAFGFSRGAFTIRVLVGLIASQGIVPYNGNESELDRLALAAWRAYRYKYRLRFNYIGPLRKMRDAVIARLARMRGLRPYAEIERIGTPDIEFLGLWDTVDAYGLPIDELTRGIDKVVWPVTMRDMNLSSRVKRAAHALALDDERNTFHPRIWNELPGDEERRISQVWFAGMHSDVGGGYADQGLSHISLDWVADIAETCGLRFLDRVRTQQNALGDENGPMNDSRHGIAGYYRYNPRRLERLLAPQPGVRPKVHESVMRRMVVGQDAYVPIVLPFDFDVVRLDGTVMRSADYLRIDEVDEATMKSAYDEGREQVFNLVWWKRVVYFATLGLTFALLLLPLLTEASSAACTSVFCFLSPAIGALDLVLPDFARGWTNWYATHPDRFFILGVLVLLGLRTGSTLQGKIQDTMRKVWYAIPGAKPTSVGALLPVKVGSRADAVVRHLRTHWLYQKMLYLLTWRVLPAGFLGGLVWVVAGLVTAGVFSMRASSGAICEKSPIDAIAVGEAAREFQFHPGDICPATGMALQAGGVYRLVLTVQEPLKDLHAEADLRSVRPEDVSWLMRAGTLLRRQWSEPWFAPMARIGERGTDAYALKPDPSVPFRWPLTELSTRLVARSSGELFLYVNDAVGPPGFTGVFYANNVGSIRVSVSRIGPDPGPPTATLAQTTGEEPAMPKR